MTIRTALGLMTVFVFLGCSSDSAKRFAYESLENKRQQDCQKVMSPDCKKRPNYDDYKQQRKELEPPEK